MTNAYLTSPVGCLSNKHFQINMSENEPLIIATKSAPRQACPVLVENRLHFFFAPHIWLFTKYFWFHQNGPNPKTMTPPDAGEDVKPPELSSLLVGMQNGRGNLGNSLVVLVDPIPLSSSWLILTSISMTNKKGIHKGKMVLLPPF